MAALNREDLEKLSKEQLIERFLQLKPVSDTGNITPIKNETKESGPVKESPCSIEIEPHSTSANITTSKQKSKQNRGFDMSKYQRRPIALKIAYLGWDYMGLASQGVNSAALPLSMKNGKNGLKVVNPNGDKQSIVATIEDYIFAALEKSKLIVDPKEVVVSRCGRTDKGVSGLCQVLSIELRSALSKESLEANPLEVLGELPYVDMANKFLPEDIRIISWAPVSASFNARFDCTGRSYKYFFTTDGTDLDINLMQQACDFLVGSHDYRNFCRQDGSKQMTSFTRDIFEARIQPASISYPGQPSQANFFELYVRGSGFLWHQIRCIMTILFRIGQSHEEPSLIKELMNVEVVNEKPAYDLACPYPLVLYDCTYNTPIAWQNTSPLSLVSLKRTYRNTYTLWYESLTKAYHYANLLNLLDSDVGSKGVQELRKFDNDMIPIVSGGGHDTHTRKYIPFLKRQRSASVDVINMKYLQRKQAKALANKKVE